MRLALILYLAAFPAAAWDFKPAPLCTVTHATPQVDLKMTYDHISGLYALSLNQATPWPDARVFSIQFNGVAPLRIATDRQTMSDGARTLTAADTGFGNVLDGLEFNETAIAILGDLALPIPLSGAAPVIQEFRDCTRSNLS